MEKSELRVIVGSVEDVLDDWDESGDAWDDDEVRQAFIDMIPDVRVLLSLYYELYT